MTGPTPLVRLPAGPISRRDLLCGAATGLATLALGRDAKGEAAPPRPPNILFILADDLGYADVACYGRPDLKTPNIDRLATHGVRLLQAYSNSAVCTATRVALITGRYQYRLRVGLEEPPSAPSARLKVPEPPRSGGCAARRTPSGRCS